MVEFFKKKNLAAFTLSLIGTIFLIYYIFRASENVVASDYLRLINYYLPDTKDLHFLLSWEGISRIPFTFLARFINTEYFHYNVFFDKILGIFGLFLFNFVTVKFVLSIYKNFYIKVISSLIITLVSFSLLSWEMILNGTGYAHFITCGLIALTFYLYSKFEDKEDVKENKLFVKNSLLQFTLIGSLLILTSLCFAGSYGVAYLSTIIFFSILRIFLLLKEKNQKEIIKHIAYIFISIVCIFCFMKSNSTGEPLIPVGEKDTNMLEVLSTDITFPIRFVLKSLASAIIGVETFAYAINFGTITEKMIYFVGLLYLLIILFAFIVFVSKFFVKDKFSKEKYFIYMYIVLGLFDFALIFLARYKFLEDDYGMSSRYGIQYMFLTIGLTMFFMSQVDTFLDTKNKTKTAGFVCIICVLSVFIFMTGHITTNTDEIFKADYRKIAYKNLVEIAKNYRNYDFDTLSSSFEYKRGGDQIIKALKILEDNNLNVFYKK